jgi:Entner-Doudoroff aldolase
VTPDQFLDILWRERGCPIMRSSSQEAARAAMDAAIRGGFRVVEFTMNTPGVLELISEFSRRDGVVCGAGTVMTTDQARAAVGAGARFLVSPVTDVSVIEEAHRLGVAIAPGTYSPTEMWEAHRAGAQLQKLFPVTAAGPNHVRSVLGPMPFLRIVPTNGVNLDNAADYLEAGAFSVGFVSCLFDPVDMEIGNWPAIEVRAQRMHAALTSVTRPDQRPGS